MFKLRPRRLNRPPPRLPSTLIFIPHPYPSTARCAPSPAAGPKAGISPPRLTPLPHFLGLPRSSRGFLATILAINLDSLLALSWLRIAQDSRLEGDLRANSILHPPPPHRLQSVFTHPYPSHPLPLIQALSSDSRFPH